LSFMNTIYPNKRDLKYLPYQYFWCFLIYWESITIHAIPILRKILSYNDRDGILNLLDGFKNSLSLGLKEFRAQQEDLNSKK